MLKIIQKTKVWVTISIALTIIGLAFLLFKGMNYGIDFRGGTIISININKEFKKADIDAIADNYAKERYSTKVVNNGKEIEIIVQEGILNGEATNKLINDVKAKYSLEESAVLGRETIGATVGNELKQKSLWAVALASIAILIYVTVRFEFNFAVAAIIALLHDVFLTVSVYAVFGIQVNTPFIAAALTILGYSITDTIVVFDRIRENIKKNRRMDAAEVADLSINETLARSINTTLLTLITITSVYIFVPTVREFSLPLIIGIGCGAYSSIFIASPLWVVLKNRKSKSKKKIAA